MELLTRDKILSSQTERRILPEGLTVEEMLAAVEWDMAVRDFTVVMVNGHELDRRYWSRIRPKPGTQVFVAVRPGGGFGGGGGGSGKQILTAVASIAIMVAAIYLAPGLVAAGGFTTAAGYSATTIAAITAGTQAAIGIAGVMALSFFVKTPTGALPAITQNPSSDSSPDENSLYGVSGGSNAINRYGVVPKLFGRARLTPNMAAEPYIISSGPAQTIRLLLDFGYGPLQIEDVRVGTSSISEFPSLKYVVHTMFKAGDELKYYTRDNSTVQIGAVLAENVVNVRQTPQLAKRIFIDIAFPGGLAEYDTQGGAHEKTEIVYIYVRSPPVTGGWVGINQFPATIYYEGASGVQAGGEVFQGAQTVSFAKRDANAISWNVSQGERPKIGDFIVWQDYRGQITNILEPISNPPDATFDPGHAWLILDQPLPGWLVWDWYGNWSIAWNFPQAQLFRGSYTSSVGPLRGWFGANNGETFFAGRTRAGRTLSISVELPWEGEWEVQVTRVTPVSGDPLITNQMQWAALRAERPQAPIAPRTPRTIMEVEVLATEQISGQIQNINALVTSIMYDWRQARWMPSRNPAVAYYDLMTCEANKRRVTMNEMDMLKLTHWANWCDSMSAQGDVVATCDYLVESRGTVSDVAQTICAAGRAMPSVIDGRYSVLMEAEERVPVQMFTNRNTRSMSSSRVWIDEPHALKVRYLSEATWERDELIVYMDGYNQFNATRFETLDLVGTVRPWQAWRMGRYYLAQARLRKETLTIETDLENLVCQRGDLVRVGHDHLLSSQVARVMSINGNRITLDSVLDPRGDIATPLEYDFVLGSAPASMSFTRASRATYWDGVGWQTVANNVPRFVPDGLLIEDVGNNLIRNSRGTGTNVGVMPTYWARSPNSRGLQVDILGVFQEDLVNMVRFHVQGVATSSGIYYISQEQSNIIPVTPGETITYSVFSRIPQGVASANVVLRYYTAANVQSSIDNTGEESSSPTLTRHTMTRVVPPNAAFVQPAIAIAIENGKTYNFEIEIGWPQLEKKPFATTPMLPASGFTSAQVRDSDKPSFTLSSLGIAGDGRSTIGLELKINSLQNQPLFQIDDNTVNNQIAIWEKDSRIMLRIASGGVVQEIDAGPFDVTNFIELTMEMDGQGGVKVTVGKGGLVIAASGAPAAGLVGLRFGPAYAVLRSLTVIPGTIRQDQTGVQLRRADGQILPPEALVSVIADDELEVSPAMAAQAAPGDLIAVGKVWGTLTDWIVDAISPGGDLTANITLIEYAPAVQWADSGPIPPYVPANSVTGALPFLGPVRNLHLTINQGYSDIESINIVKVDWDPPAGYIATEYLVERIYQDDVRVQVARTPDTFLIDYLPTIGVPPSGLSVTYFVTPITRINRRGATAIAQGAVLPDTNPPSKVKLTANVLGNSTRLMWSLPPENDVASFQLRWTPDFDLLEWNQMQIVLDSISSTTNSAMIHTRSGVYAIRSVDISGNWSEPAYVRTIVQDASPVDPTYSLAVPAWDGTFHNTELDANGNLVLSKGVDGTYFAEGYYEFASTLVMGRAWRPRVESKLVMDVFPDPGILHSTHDAQLYVAAAQNLPKLNSPWFTPLATAKPLSGKPTNFSDWTPVISEWITGQIFWFRAYLFSRDRVHTPVVKSAQVEVYFDPRTESGSDVRVATGSLSVTYRYPFLQPPSLQLILNDGAVGDRIVKVSDTATGFQVEIRDATGGALVMGRHLDWNATGIGIAP